ncbi:hypothetical protein B484DRAFT_402679, partial [Ochromonadaceae sp. CCMP2298]
QVYVNSPKVKGDTLQALVADAVTGVRENYCHKTYAVAALFRHVPGGDWPAGVLELIEEKRAKTPTATFLKGARMQRRDPEAQRKCFFGELILSTAKKVCSVVIGHMNANYVAPEDLDSGLGMHDMYFALRKKSIRKGLKGQVRADAIAEKAALMLSTIIYYDRARDQRQNQQRGTSISVSTTDDECRAAKEAHLLIVQERVRNRAAPLPTGLPAPATPVIAVAPPHAQEDPVA